MEKESLSVVAETLKSITLLLHSLSSVYLVVGKLRRTPSKSYFRLSLVLLPFQIRAQSFSYRIYFTIMYELSNWKPQLRGDGQVCCWREAFDHILASGISWCCTTKATLAGAPGRALCWTSFQQLCRADRPCTPKASLYSKLGGFQVNPSLQGPILFASSALGLLT